MEETEQSQKAYRAGRFIGHAEPGVVALVGFSQQSKLAGQKWDVAVIKILKSMVRILWLGLWDISTRKGSLSNGRSLNRRIACFSRCEGCAQRRSATMLG